MLMWRVCAGAVLFCRAVGGLIELNVLHGPGWMGPKTCGLAATRAQQNEASGREEWAEERTPDSVVHIRKNGSRLWTLAMRHSLLLLCALECSMSRSGLNVLLGNCLVYKLKLPSESMNETFCVLFSTQGWTMNHFTDNKYHETIVCILF